jgi:AraC-like DNA-binding protein
MSDRSDAVMDPLSEVLSLLKLRSYMSGAFQAGGEWSIGFKQHDGIKFQAVVYGDCWLAVDGVPEAVRVTAGDCLLLPRGRAFRICSDLALPPQDFPAAPTIRGDGITSYNGGKDFLSIGGYFTLAGENSAVLLELLPPIVHIRKESDKASLRWCLERLREELREPQAGSSLVAQQLASLMLLQALRLHLSGVTRGDSGWLFALSDKQMSVALHAMHADPARRWTLQALAEVVGMSRTAFVLKFKKTVGVSVMEYLTRWRMLLAGNQLIQSEDTIESVALSLGYESESSFSSSFKKVTGVSPGRYRRLRSASAAVHDEPT